MKNSFIIEIFTANAANHKKVYNTFQIKNHENSPVLFFEL